MLSSNISNLAIISISRSSLCITTGFLTRTNRNGIISHILYGSSLGIPILMAEII
jgi:hypothetical protein